MKYAFLNLLILLAISNNFYAQSSSIPNLVEYKATYKLTYQPNKNNPNNLNTEEMYLYMGNGVSKFGSAGKTIGDSIMDNRDKTKEKNKIDFLRIMAKIPETKFNYVIYKGIPKLKMTFIHKIFKDEFKYITLKDQLDWKVHPESKSYKNFKVQKAKTSFRGRNYIAWFTPEVPISEGPYKFNGLPGLILEIDDTENHWNFEFSGLEKLSPKAIIL